MVETFFQTIKSALVWCTVSDTYNEASHTIASYIDGFYNPVRRYSALDYIAPLSSNELRHAEQMPLHFYGASRTHYVGSWRDLAFSGRQLKDCKVPLFAILRSPFGTYGGYERMSEMGERATTAECRLVGLPAAKRTGSSRPIADMEAAG